MSDGGSGPSRGRRRRHAATGTDRDPGLEGRADPDGRYQPGGRGDPGLGPDPRRNGGPRPEDQRTGDPRLGGDPRYGSSGRAGGDPRLGSDPRLGPDPRRDPGADPRQSPGIGPHPDAGADPRGGSGARARSVSDTSLDPGFGPLGARSPDPRGSRGSGTHRTPAWARIPGSARVGFPMLAGTRVPVLTRAGFRAVGRAGALGAIRGVGFPQAAGLVPGLARNPVSHGRGHRATVRRPACRSPPRPARWDPKTPWAHGGPGVPIKVLARGPATGTGRIQAPGQ